MNCPRRSGQWFPCFPRGWLQSKWAVAAPFSNFQRVETHGLVIFLVGHPRLFFPLALFVLSCCFLPVSSPKAIKVGMRKVELTGHHTLESQGNPQGRLPKSPRVTGGRSAEAGARVSPNHREHLVCYLGGTLYVRGRTSTVDVLHSLCECISSSQSHTRSQLWATARSNDISQKRHQVRVVLRSCDLLL